MNACPKSVTEFGKHDFRDADLMRLDKRERQAGVRLGNKQLE
jgi:hypothetical protein